MWRQTESWYRGSHCRGLDKRDTEEPALLESCWGLRTKQWDCRIEANCRIKSNHRSTRHGGHNIKIQDWRTVEGRSKTKSKNR